MPPLCSVLPCPLQYLRYVYPLLRLSQSVRSILAVGGGWWCQILLLLSPFFPSDWHFLPWPNRWVVDEVAGPSMEVVGEMAVLGLSDTQLSLD
ncbi:hypothetical protein BDZ91DRAFT_726170 [Kalaharituber pfeilii]|nr:hypothetical protein BDZ91DRAFT_726170 [Kalaharituber pfeilii]